MNWARSTYGNIIGPIKGYSLLERIQLLLGLLFVITITLDQKVNSVLLMAFLFSLAFSFRIEKFKAALVPILILTAGFVFSMVSLSYTSNFHEGRQVIERQLALFFIPVLFLSGFKLDRYKLLILLKCFFIAIMLISLYLIKLSVGKFMDSGVRMDEWFVRDNLYHSFAKPIGMHATYLSLYIGLAIFTGFYWLLLNNTLLVKLLIFLGLFILITTLILLSSRSVISSVLAIIFLVYPFYASGFKYKSLLVLGALIIGCISFFLVQESSFIKDRFIEKIKDEIKLKPFLKADSTYNPVYGGETRADRWFCAVELIRERPLLGFGTGSEKDVLMQKYKKYNLQNAEVNNYDAHNQYLAFTIKSGIPGLILFLLPIFYAFRLSVRRKSFIYLAFILLFSITCITENVLESNKGIFFYAFFNALFCTFCLAKNDPPEMESR